jgi:hypothetical protein
MVSDLACPECGAAVHPCSYDYHVERCKNGTEEEKLRALLDEFYHISKSFKEAGEELWCGCRWCNNMEERIKKALKVK